MKTRKRRKDKNKGKKTSKRQKLTETSFERFHEADDEGGTARDLLQHLRNLKQYPSKYAEYSPNVFLVKDQNSKISDAESSIISRTCLGHLVLLCFLSSYHALNFVPLCHANASGTGLEEYPLPDLNFFLLPEPDPNYSSKFSSSDFSHLAVSQQTASNLLIISFKFCRFLVVLT